MVQPTADEAPSPRAERRAATTSRIEDAAFELLLDGGLEGLKVAKVAERLDYAVGALYRYFPSKEALMLALLRRVVEGLDADLDLALDVPDTGCGDVDSLRRLLVAAHVYGSLPERRPAEYRLLALMLGDPKPLVPDGVTPPALVQAATALFARLAGLFAEAEAGGALRPGAAPMRAVAFFAQLHGTLTLYKLARFEALPLSPSQVAENGTRSLLLGYGADAERLDQAFAGLHANL